MKFLDQIDEAGREAVIAALLSEMGLIGKVRNLTGGKFGTIYKIDYTNSDIDRVAKCPNFIQFDSKNDRKKVFEKAFYELEKTYDVRHNPWFNTFIDLKMIVNWPFFISRYWDFTLFDLIGNPSKWNLSDKIQVCLIVLRGMITAQEVGIRSHQDLKPENVFIKDFGKSLIGSSEGNGIKYWPKIGDLGMADAFSAFGMNSASRPYQAPEQYKKDFIDEEAALKLDCFAFGVLFHEIFTDGIHPIGEKTRDVWPNPLNGQKNGLGRISGRIGQEKKIRI